MKTNFCAGIFNVGMLLTLWALSGPAIGADVEGSGDHELIKRMEGSEIIWSQVREEDELTVALDRVEWDYTAEKFKDTKKERAEGKHTVLYYKLPLGIVDKEAVKQYQEGLLAAGFITVFSGSNDELDDGYNRFVEQILPDALKDEQLQYLHQFNHEEQCYAALRGSGMNGNTVYISIYAMTIVDNSGTGFEKIQEAHQLENGGVVVRIDILETKGSDARMALLKAEDISKALSTKGRVAVYGVHFDSDKAEIGPDSTASLVEIAKAIKDAGDQKFMIVGHTDNQGGYAQNQTLSSRRAAAVVAELVGVYDIPADRLIPVGVGMAAPLVPNVDEDGRAKNRRIEIVSM